MVGDRRLCCFAGFSLPLYGSRDLGSASGVDPFAAGGVLLAPAGLAPASLAVLLTGIAVILFVIGGRAMLARHAAVVRFPSRPSSGQAVIPTQQNNAASPGTQHNSAVPTPALQKTVSLPESPVGLGQGPSGRMWVFEAQRPVLPVDRLALLDESTGSTVFSQNFGTTATAYTVDSNGNAWVAEDQNGPPVVLKYDSSSFKAPSYSLPGSVTKVVGGFFGLS